MRTVVRRTCALARAVAPAFPAEFQSARQMASYETRSSFLKDTFLSDDFLKQHYALDLASWHKQGEAEETAP